MSEGAPPRLPRRPEVLAPAGDFAALQAALQSGADAVYFGLDEGFNARARAANFPVARLPETVRRIHESGARAYLALNTLVFEPELGEVEALVRAAASAGVDALIVQDPAVALVARALCPALEVHASTQMTIATARAARFAKDLGVTRVVVPRELSVAEIRAFAAGTDLELEVFVHGALCVSWSGQCLTSEAWSGRSANRGQCAQSCRMPYDLLVDGAPVDLGDVKYLLSPKDLAGLRAVRELAALGVHGLKIEGRQKGPVYVATAVRGYRRAVDALPGAAEDEARADLRAMALAYTRGFSDGFLAGSDHQTLVEGRFPKHRGLLLGRVLRVLRGEVEVEADPQGRPWTGARGAEERPAGAAGDVRSPLAGFGGPANSAGGPAPAPLEVRPGHGVVFDAGEPEDKHEPGGPVFRVERRGDRIVLGFGNPGPDLGRVRIGQRVWVTSDPEVGAAVDREAKRGAPTGRIGVALEVSGRAGAPLAARARARGAVAAAASASPLEPARGPGLDAALLADKLGAFGGTPFHLEALDAGGLAPGLHLPVSQLKELRRALLESLGAALFGADRRPLAAEPALPRVRAALAPADAGAHAARAGAAPTSAVLVPLCRSDAQLEAALALGLSEVELDWMELVGLKRACARARAAGARAIVATLRVQKPLEEAFFAAVRDLAPDGILVRHLDALVAAREDEALRGTALHGDFSLNVANSVSAALYLRQGLATLTPSLDLDEVQLCALLDRVPPERVTATLHHRIATFHTEHCVYAHLLSAGRDFRTCGRPCETKQVSLRDHEGRVHPVIVDAGCRNTVFNAEAQSAAELVPELLERGVRRFRVEFVRETEAEAARALEAYRALLAGAATPAAARAAAGAIGRVGVVAAH